MFKFIKKLFRRKDKMGEQNINLSEVENIIMWYFASRKYREMKDGNDYYRGKHDILFRQRTAIGENGELTEVHNLPNNRIVDNQYKKLVKQKVNYIISKTPSIKSENQEYDNKLNELFDKNFLKILKRVTTDVYNNGLGWLFLYVDETGKLRFKRLNSVEVIPVWLDNEHEELDYAIRVYSRENEQYKTYSN